MVVDRQVFLSATFQASHFTSEAHLSFYLSSPLLALVQLFRRTRPLILTSTNHFFPSCLNSHCADPTVGLCCSGAKSVQTSRTLLGEGVSVCSPEFTLQAFFETPRTFAR